MAAEYSTLIFVAGVIAIILTRWSIYTHFMRRGLVEVMEKLMHENVPLHLVVYNSTMELVEELGYELKNVQPYYIVYDEEGRIYKKGMLTEVYMALYNQKKFNTL